MKVFFLDVAQGTCQILLTGNQRAIVIDTGSSADTALRLLKLLRIQTIELLILSHSHNDHLGGTTKSSKRTNALRPQAVAGIASAYRGAIDRYAYVYDSDFKTKPIARFLQQELNSGRMNSEQLFPLVANERPVELWHSVDQSTTLSAIAPLGGHHLIASLDENPNACAAILELRHRGHRILFTSDSEYSMWRDIHRLRNSTSIQCKVATVPHHGGQMQGTKSDLDWLCNTAIKADYAIISAGTSNTYGHPTRDVVRAFQKSGSHVMCTQITERCCNDLESVRPGVIGPILYPSRSKSAADKTSSSKSRNVACTGTIVATLSNSGITVERDTEHRNGVNNLARRGFLPMCRS